MLEKTPKVITIYRFKNNQIIKENIKYHEVKEKFS